MDTANILANKLSANFIPETPTPTPFIPEGTVTNYHKRTCTEGTPQNEEHLIYGAWQQTQLHNSTKQALGDPLIFFNLSLATDFDSWEWCAAVGMPLHKGGPTTDPRNYTHISLTSLAYKAKEHITTDLINYNKTPSSLVCQGDILSNESCELTLRGLLRPQIVGKLST